MNGGNFVHDAMPAPPAGDGLVMPMFSLKGKTAIVSGAGAGIGLAVAHAYAEAGANVAIWYNSNKKAIEEAANIEKKFKVKCKLRRRDRAGAARCARCRVPGLTRPTRQGISGERPVMGDGA